MSDKPEDQGDGLEPQGRTDRRVRADAQRNLDALLHAAKAVFATSGVDAPVREIAEKAGVGIGTVYRHFPQRSDLIAAVFRREIDACADAAPILCGRARALRRPGELDAAICRLHRGQARARQGAAFGRPGVRHLAGYFDQRLGPPFATLLEAAAAAGEVRADVDADELLGAVASLCMSAHNNGPGRAERMVALSRRRGCAMARSLARSSDRAAGSIGGVDYAVRSDPPRTNRPQRGASYSLLRSER